MFSLDQKDFSTFKKYCKEAIAKFQLTDWEVEFDFEDLDCNYRGNKFAVCKHSSGTSKMAEICLNTYWCKRPTKQRLKNTAYHEVLHLLFADMYNIAMDIDLGFSQRQEYLDGAIHSCINRLMPVLSETWKEDEDSSRAKKEK